MNKYPSWRLQVDAGIVEWLKMRSENSSPPQLQYHSASLPDQSSQSVGVINSNGAPSADHSKVHSTHNILWHTLKGLRICLPVRPVIDVDVQVPSGKYRDPHHLSDLFHIQRPITLPSRPLHSTKSFNPTLAH